MIQVNMNGKENASVTINGTYDNLILEFEAIIQGIVTYSLSMGNRNMPEIDEKTIFNMMFPKIEKDLTQAFERGIGFENDILNIEYEEGK